MRDILNKRHSVIALQRGGLNLVKLSIHPVDSLGNVINRETIWEPEVGVDDDFAMGPIQVGSFNSWLVPPICPVHVTVKKTQS